MSSRLPGTSSFVIIIAHFAVFCLAGKYDLSTVFFFSPRPNFWNSQWTEQHWLSAEASRRWKGWPSLCQADETVPELGTKSCAEGHLPVPSGLFISLIDCFVVCCQALSCAGSAHGRIGRSGRAVQLPAWRTRPRGACSWTLQPDLHPKAGEALLAPTGGAGLCRNEC